MLLTAYINVCILVGRKLDYGYYITMWYTIFIFIKLHMVGEQLRTFMGKQTIRQVRNYLQYLPIYFSVTELMTPGYTAEDNASSFSL